MDWPGFAKRVLVADGRICDTETSLMRRALLAGGLDREEIGFVVRLKRVAITVHPSFDELVCEVLRAVVLADGRVSDDEAEWLRSIIFADGKVSEVERDFIIRLRAEVPQSAGLERLYEDVMSIDRTDMWG